MIIAQNESRTKLRIRISSGFSGGGSFFAETTLALFAEASSTSFNFPSFAPDLATTGAEVDVAILKLLILVEALDTMSIF